MGAAPSHAQVQHGNTVLTTGILNTQRGNIRVQHIQGGNVWYSQSAMDEQHGSGTCATREHSGGQCSGTDKGVGGRGCTTRQAAPHTQQATHTLLHPMLDRLRSPAADARVATLTS